jgi:hypothetical protein
MRNERIWAARNTCIDRKIENFICRYNTAHVIAIAYISEKEMRERNFVNTLRGTFGTSVNFEVTLRPNVLR